LKSKYRPSDPLISAAYSVSVVSVVPRTVAWESAPVRSPYVSRRIFPGGDA
jgi:hypothetical protein